LKRSSTPALDEIHVYEESISDVHDALVESSTPSHDVRCSLFTLKIEEEIEHEIVATNIDTSESLGFLPIICQVIPSVSFFSDCLEFFSEFLHTSVNSSNVMPLEVFDVHSPRKPYISILYL